MLRKTLLSTLLISVSSLSSAVTLRDNSVIIYHPGIPSLSITNINHKDTSGYTITPGQPFDSTKAKDNEGLDINIRAGRKSSNFVAQGTYNFFKTNSHGDIEQTSSHYINDFTWHSGEANKKDVKDGIFALHAHSIEKPNFSIKTSLDLGNDDLGNDVKIKDIVLSQYGYNGHNPWAIYARTNSEASLARARTAAIKNHCIYLQATDQTKYTLCGFNNSSNEFVFTKGWSTGTKNTSTFHHNHVYFRAGDGVNSLNFVPSKDVEGLDNSASHYITPGQLYLGSYVTASQDKEAIDIDTFAGRKGSSDVADKLKDLIDLENVWDQSYWKYFNFYISGTLYINGEQLINPLYIAQISGAPEFQHYWMAETTSSSKIPKGNSKIFETISHKYYKIGPTANSSYNELTISEA